MSQTHDMPFGIRDVAELVGIRIRRPSGRGFYADCPFCGDKRGKLHLNTEFDGWKCNHCGERGGMLNLYCRLRNVGNSEAYRQICDALMTGEYYSVDYQPSTKPERMQEQPDQSDKADIAVIDKTFTALLSMLTLTKEHREHLRTKRGLTDEQIESLGYKSTPPFYMCRPLTKRLLEKGCTVKGVPGFYIGKDGEWTVRFNSVTAGFLIPARGIDGRIQGCQIRLDVPLKNDDDDSDKDGAKYIWLSSAGKPKGTSSGSPVFFFGNPCTRTVYITEGGLKAGIAHCLMNRTFAATAGANNMASLKELFQILSANGTEVIMEAEDMDKYRNSAVNNGASQIYLLAKKHGMECRRLTWNPNYKGIDDWQLALKRQKEVKEDRKTNFRTRFLYGLCDFDRVYDETAEWHESTETVCELQEHLGFTEEEYEFFLKNGNAEMKKYLLSKQAKQKYRIYQLDFTNGGVIPFAFEGIKGLYAAGYEQPPASLYRQVYDGALLCVADDGDTVRLEHIFCRYNPELPEGYSGRNISPSDVIELYDEDARRYFYRDKDKFVPVKFSPMLAKR